MNSVTHNALAVYSIYTAISASDKTKICELAIKNLADYKKISVFIQIFTI